MIVKKMYISFPLGNKMEGHLIYQFGITTSLVQPYCSKHCQVMWVSPYFRTWPMFSQVSGDFQATHFLQLFPLRFQARPPGKLSEGNAFLPLGSN